MVPVLHLPFILSVFLKPVVLALNTLRDSPLVYLPPCILLQSEALAYPRLARNDCRGAWMALGEGS